MNTSSLANIISDFLNENPYVTLMVFICTVASVILAIYFYYKSKKNKKPTYIVRTINLVNENIKHKSVIDFLYLGQKINNISFTKIAFWNDGKDTINFSDVARNLQLKIEIKEGCKILDCKILYQKNIANDFKTIISEDAQSAFITFDYFDYEEGIVLELTHTGNSSEDIELKGSIKTVKSIIKKTAGSNVITNLVNKFIKKGIISEKRLLNLPNYFTLAMGWMFMGIFICSFFIEYNTLRSFTEGENSKLKMQISYFIASFMMLFIWYSLNKKEIPKGFDIFNEEFLEDSKNTEELPSSPK